MKIQKNKKSLTNRLRLINYFRITIISILLYLSKYSRFFLKFIPLYPSEASLQVTGRCNSKCITCNFWKIKPGDELTPEELKRVFHDFKDVGLQIVGFTGGECLLRPDIGDLIDNVINTAGVKVYIITNGILLEKKAEILAGKDLLYVAVSLDGIGKTDDTIRGIPGHYEMVIRGIDRLNKLTEGKLRIHIGTTLLKQNINQVPEIIELCKKHNATWAFALLDANLYFFKGINVSEIFTDDKILINKTIDRLYDFGKKEPKTFIMPPWCLEFSREYLLNKAPHFHCVVGYYRVFIDPQLNVYPGCWALPPLGNLREKSLKQIIKSPEYTKRVKSMFDLYCPTCTCGYALSTTINNLPTSIIYGIKNARKLKN
jgi:MoaA/NifB/PqqE/SkfB family radical SAM enzyme